MDIDITDLIAFEIQGILSNYPNGRLVVKHDRIFWDSGDAKPMPRPNEDALPINRHPPRQSGDDIGKRFERMADTLGSMVC